VTETLDEFPENSAKSRRQELLDRIKRMVERESECLHILAMSRNEHDIRATLGISAAGGISIQSSKVDADIRMHVRTRLAEDPMLKLLQAISKQTSKQSWGKELMACELFYHFLCSRRRSLLTNT
jgi:hypothetical protein